MAIQQVHESTTAMTHPSHTRGQRIDRYLYRPGRQLGDLLLHYWAHMLTFVLGLIVLIALLIPFLSYVGLDVIAKPLFFALHAICAQIPSHSFYTYLDINSACACVTSSSTARCSWEDLSLSSAKSGYPAFPGGYGS